MSDMGQNFRVVGDFEVVKLKAISGRKMNSPLPLCLAGVGLSFAAYRLNQPSFAARCVEWLVALSR